MEPEADPQGRQVQPARSASGWQACDPNLTRWSPQTELGGEPSGSPQPISYFSLSSPSRKGPKVYIITHQGVCILILLPSVELVASSVRILGISDLRGQRRVNTPRPPPMVLEVLVIRSLCRPLTEAPGKWSTCWPLLRVAKQSLIGHKNHGDFQLCGSPLAILSRPLIAL